MDYPPVPVSHLQEDDPLDLTSLFHSPLLQMDYPPVPVSHLQEDDPLVPLLAHLAHVLCSCFHSYRYS